jgi:folate-dependent phosphoribosylglycinamide formyltransferase PurN
MTWNQNNIDHKKFLKFINLDEQIKKKLKLFSLYQDDQGFNEIFSKKPLLSSINCLTHFFKLTNINTILNFREILKRKLIPDDFDSINRINSLETIIHIYPFFYKNLIETREICTYVHSNIQNIESIMEKANTKDIYTVTYMLKYTYVCLIASNNPYLNNTFDYKSHLKKSIVSLQSLVNEEMSLYNFLAASYYFFRISNQISDFKLKLQDPFIKKHENILHNFEILIAKGKIFETLIFKELGNQHLEAYIFLVLTWIQLFYFSKDIRFFNASIKLLGYFCDYENLGTNISTNFNILVIEALLECNKIITFLKQDRDFLEKLLNKNIRQILIKDDQCKSLVENNIKIVALVGENSSTFFSLWNDLKKEGLKIDAIIWVNDPISIYNSPYNLPWYPGWPNEELQKINKEDILIPMFKIKNINSLDNINLIKEINPDVFILISSEVISKEVLALARLGTVNAHNGILPTYRGMDSVAWAVLHNDQIGCTLHAVDQGVDTGDIIAIKFVSLQLIYTKSLKQLVKEKQSELLCDFIKFIRTFGRFPERESQSEQASKRYYRMHPNLRGVCTDLFQRYLV